MKRRSKHFGGMSEFTSIAEIFISNSCRITTICGSRISNTEVWIKVCDLNFQEADVLFRY
jgi:hypothetical protein